MFNLTQKQAIERWSKVTKPCHEKRAAKAAHDAKTSRNVINFMRRKLRQQENKS